MYNTFVCLQVNIFFTSTLLHSTLVEKEVKSVLKKIIIKVVRKKMSSGRLGPATMHTADSHSASKVLSHFYMDFPGLILYLQDHFFLVKGALSAGMALNSTLSLSLFPPSSLIRT